MHISSVQLDLCDLSTVRRAAAQLVRGTVPFDGLGPLRIPRLDAVVFNAGLGGWTGISWLGFAWDVVSLGWVEATHRPVTMKVSTPGLTVDPLPSRPDSAKDEKETTTRTTTTSSLGMVFCANVFGHYLLAHDLQPLLSRAADDALPPGRVIWQSSVAPMLSHLDVDDLQGLKSRDAYESSKMLTDVLCLTADLPSVRPYSATYFSTTTTTTTSSSSSSSARPPKTYLAHPGIVATTMFPLHWSLMWGYVLGTLLSRWLGSPWFPVYPYSAAVATTWLALAPQDELDGQGAEHVKWGSATDFWGTEMVKKTEVDGWGWEGKVESEEDIRRQDRDVVRTLRKSVGRGAVARKTLLTEERRAAFEEMGARCWEEMERLRGQWEPRLERASANGKI